MTFIQILDDLRNNLITETEAFDKLFEKDNKKLINYYIWLCRNSNDTLKENQLQELQSIVEVLNYLYNNGQKNIISDEDYDILQERLVDQGIPRQNEIISSDNKVNHQYTNLRGTLDKIYYLDDPVNRTNKSRKSLDEWIKSSEARYKRNTGKDIDLSDAKVFVSCKYDGTSVVLNNDGINMTYLTRGDTKLNLASDVTNVMKQFNDIFSSYGKSGQKFEVMITEEGKDKINEYYPKHPYKNSRQIATSILNTKEVDFKSEFLYPVPLRIQYPDNDIEEIHPLYLEKFPYLICTLNERDKLKEFAYSHRYAKVAGSTFRTDGIVLTIMDPKIQSGLSRENAINKFEVAFKFTEEFAYAKVRDINFYVSEFGYITPVLQIFPITLKGNTIENISLSNKERFDELNLHYNDTVKILYDIIPYAVLDENCKRQPNGRKIPFVKNCPRCHEPLDLDVVQVQCKNPRCPSRLLGKIMNYCTGVNMKNIGSSIIESLWDNGLLNKGIRSLYKLKKHIDEIENLEGFGKLKTRNIIKEIEAKRNLFDYDFFGSLGIESLSNKTFQLIFSNIKLSDFLNMIKLENYTLLVEKLIKINGIGENKSQVLVDYFKDKENVKELNKLLDEIQLIESFNLNQNSKGIVVFTGCRPNEELKHKLENLGYKSSDSWTNKCKCLIVPDYSYHSSKVDKANSLGIKIISINDIDEIKKL